MPGSALDSALNSLRISMWNGSALYMHTGQEEVVETPLVERQAVMFIWQHIERLLCSPKFVINASMRLLIEALPPLETIPAHALAELTELHLKSSADLLQTIKLIAPQAFSSDAAVPDLSTLGAAHTSLMGLLSNVTDLQVFHMRRAVAINAEMRARISAKQHLQQQASMHGSFSSSGCSDSSQNLQQQLQLLLQRQQSPQPLLQLSIDQQVLQQQQAPQLELQVSVDQQVLQLQGMIPQAQPQRAQDQALPLIIDCQQQPQHEFPGLTVQLRTPSPEAQAQAQINVQLAQPFNIEGQLQAKAAQVADASQQQQQQAQAQSGEPRQLPSQQSALFNHSVALVEASKPETQLEHDQGHGQQACLLQPQSNHHLAAQLQQAKEQLQPSPRAQPTAQAKGQVQLVPPSGQIRQRRLRVSLAPQIQFEAHLEAIQCHMQQLGLQAKQSQPHMPVLRQNSRQQLMMQKLEQKLQRIQQPEQQ